MTADTTTPEVLIPFPMDDRPKFDLNRLGPAWVLAAPPIQRDFTRSTGPVRTR